MQFFLLDPSINGVEGFRDLGWVQSSLTVHVSFFTSFQCQCSKSQQGYFSQKSAVSPPYASPSSPATSCSFSQCIISNNPWMAAPLSVHETYTSSLYSGLLQGEDTFHKETAFFFVTKLCLSNFLILYE